MSLIHRAFGDADTSFTPLFRLLDDFDNYSRQGGLWNQGHGRRSNVAAWQPRFDVRETGDEYELHGELPGMKKEEIQIEFPEPQTLAVRGKSERSYSASTPVAGRIEDVSEKPPITQGGQDSSECTPNRTKRDGTSNTNTEQSPAHAKFWLSERSVGEFYRTFHFPAPVDQDGVSAKLNDGILSVSVPKVKRPEPRRVAIN